MTDSSVYWIWLTNAIGYNNPRHKRIYELYSSIKNFYLGGEKEWRFSGLFTDREITALKNSSLSKAEDIFSKAVNLGYTVMTFDSNEYPDCLYNIYAPPSVVYVSGEMPDIDNRLSIAVVGSRRPREYGVKYSYNIAYNLSKAGVTIVSGGALGVDCASHRGALNAGGVTVCVLGCGINYNYLPENASMRQNITFKGALVSEYPPDTPPKAYHFPARNRLISALSDGVLVVEAGEKSGSLITANFALEQGKELFALMGPADSSCDAGSNKLIKDSCAVAVTEYTDILRAFDNIYVTKELKNPYEASKDEISVIPVKGSPPGEINRVKTVDVTEAAKPKKTPVHRKETNLSGIEAEVYKAVGAEPAHIDDIALKLNMKVFKLLPIITKLEMSGLIENTRGRCYKLK